MLQIRMVATNTLLDMVVVSVEGEVIIAPLAKPGATHEIGVVSVWDPKDIVQLPDNLAQRLVQKIEEVVGTIEAAGINAGVVDMKNRVRVAHVPGRMGGRIL